MPLLIDHIPKGRRLSLQRPWPRVEVDVAGWTYATNQLAEGRWSLLGLWGEPATVHMAVLSEGVRDVGVITLDCANGRYPSVARHHPPALRLERAVRDLFGLQADGSIDDRPWLDHGQWGSVGPLEPGASPYPFLPAEGDSLHQIPVGPVHAGIIEPGHFRFTANGETVVRLEERLGYTHKGTEGLMTGADVGRATSLAGRLSGDSTVASTLAFVRAIECALEVDVPPRAVWLRALMAELERLANHLGDIGAICNDAAFALMQAHCGVLRENVLRVAKLAFGHRLMRDVILPGGVNRDLAVAEAAKIRTTLEDIRQRFSPLIELYDNTASLQDRTVATGVLAPTLARQYAAGGYIGRASGRAFDARRAFPYPPYDTLRFEVPVMEDGDVNARVWIRIREVQESLSLVDQILMGLPNGSLQTPIGYPTATREGLAIVEGFRGDILAWLRIRGGRIERCHLRDPSWFQWPLLEAAIEGNIVADFPLCNKSFNCSYSGHDL